jgi:hypothetical protein
MLDTSRDKVPRYLRTQPLARCQLEYATRKLEPCKHYFGKRLSAAVPRLDSGGLGSGDIDIHSTCTNS